MADVFGTDQAEVLNGEDGVTGFADAVFGFGGDDWLFGLAGDDVLYGGAGGDRLDGGSGVDFANYNTSPTRVFVSLVLGSADDGDAVGDTLINIENIDGSGFNDFLTGDGNKNFLQGRGGDDFLDGEGGDDLLEGGQGADTLHGRAGNDTIHGEAGPDALIVGAGVDIVSGGSGDDLFVFGDGDVLPGEIIDGGADFDTIRVGNVTFANVASIGGIESIVIEHSRTATLTANQVKTGFVSPQISGHFPVGSGETLNIEMGAETSIDVVSNFIFVRWDATDRVVIVGDSDNESITGSAQIDRLIGNAGNDVLVGNAGADELFGGPGNDVYQVEQVSGEVTELAGQGTDSVFASFSHALAANVENLTLFGTGDTSGTGNALANTITGNSGKNILNGSAGADSLQGGLGNDTYFVDVTTDAVIEVVNAGIDQVNSAATFTLSTNVENLTLIGTASVNGTGNTLVNNITGNTGYNTLNGGVGADLLRGGLGNDTYVVDNVSDKAIEAADAGTDQVNSAVTFTLGANVENLTLTGAAAISGAGNTLANTIIGNGANNTLSGGAGVDSLRGGLGNDSYIVYHVSDQVVETAGAGTDRIVSFVTEVLALNVENLTLSGIAAINGSGNTLNNVIIGNAANNILSGSSGIDALSGGTGNDVLIGGAGKDTMTGAAGADDFDFNSIAEIGNGATRDIIRDFVHLTDDLDLSTIDANGGATGNTAFSFLAAHGAAFTGAAGQLRWFRQDLAGTANDRTIVEGDINGNKVADFMIELAGLKVLTAADFVL